MSSQVQQGVQGLKELDVLYSLSLAAEHRRIVPCHVSHWALLSLPQVFDSLVPLVSNYAVVLAMD